MWFFTTASENYLYHQHEEPEKAQFTNSIQFNHFFVLASSQVKTFTDIFKNIENDDVKAHPNTVLLLAFCSNFVWILSDTQVKY